ncbi:MAG: hypothetical protein M3315_15890 [Actinomycetota bacterium]|nr:hypothetical protein [Actinomycetota bacterium]
MDEVPRPKHTLFAFDEQQTLAAENEKVLLVGFGVVEGGWLYGPEHA